MKAVFSVVMMAWLLSGCATHSVQMRNLVQAPPDIPRAARLDTPFFSQSRNYCGPATLAMSMQAAGLNVQPDDVAPQTFSKAGSGSLPADMIGATRRRGLLAVPVDGLANILREVAGGHPVMVFQNLGLRWWPRWHYALVVGYDLDAQQIFLHSGRTKNKAVALTHFERSWRLADYWAVTVLPPHTLSVTGDEVAHLQAAAGLELAEQLNAAEPAYHEILKRWPTSLGAHVGLGNVYFRKQRPEDAAVYLRKALRLHPHSEIVRHNLRIAEAAR